MQPLFGRNPGEVADLGQLADQDPVVRNRSPQRPQPRPLRLDLAHLLALQQLQTLQPVLLTALLKGLQARLLRLIYRHDQFATHFVRDVLLAAKRDHFLNTGDGQSSPD